MKKLWILTVALMLSGVVSANDKCPVSGQAAKADVFVFEKVNTCCKNCQASLAKKLKISADPGKCPVSGQPAKAEQFLIQGNKVVNFCCGNCRKKFAESKKLNQKLSLGKTTKCPLSGNAGKEDVFLIKKVNFCCNNCKGKYAKDKGLTVAYNLPVKAKAKPQPKPVKKAAPKTKLVCPFSGKPAVEGQWILSENKKVGFCCGNCKKNYTIQKENRLSDAQKKGGWAVLFNGKNLEGFQKPTRDGKWSVQDGRLVGTAGKGVIATKGKYKNFELTLDVKIQDTGDKRGNSGIFIRSKALDGLRGRWPDGLEVQVDNGDPNFWTGAIWKTKAAKKVATKDGEWLSMKIQAIDSLIRVWVNGKVVTTHLDGSDPVEGPISLQVHHDTDVVEFKNIKVRQLSGA